MSSNSVFAPALGYIYKLVLLAFNSRDLNATEVLYLASVSTETHKLVFFWKAVISQIYSISPPEVFILHLGKWYSGYSLEYWNWKNIVFHATLPGLFKPRFLICEHHPPHKVVLRIN